MDFLDPKKQRQHHAYLMINYVLTTVGLILATTILVMLAYGFGFDKKGQVIQSGRIFVSSLPDGADIYVDDKKQSTQTNTRLLLPAGRYNMRVEKDGYLGWQRSIIANGGILERFDYVFLVPKDLKTTTTKTLTGVSEFATQSRDRRWLLVQNPQNLNGFSLSDLNNREDPATDLVVPTTILTDPSATQSWKQVEWSTNNKHVLLSRTYTATATKLATTEYILINREEPAESVNITKTLAVAGQDVRLIDGTYDQYYVLSPSTQRLTKATLKEPTPITVLNGVVAYKSYDTNKILYVASVSEAEQSSPVRLKDGNKTYTMGTLPARGTYLLDIAQHDGKWYFAIGEQSENRVAVYKNPLDALGELPNEPLVPVQVLKVTKPVRIAFSDNTRFIMATNGQDFYTYDAKNDKGYRFTASQPLDKPQEYARWMDGYRLTYISGGKLVFFDYDYTNQRTLQAADSAFSPFFDRDYEFVYTLNSSSGNSVLQSTALRTESDQ